MEDKKEEKVEEETKTEEEGPEGVLIFSKSNALNFLKKEKIHCIDFNKVSFDIIICENIFNLINVCNYLRKKSLQCMDNVIASLIVFTYIFI